MKKLFFVLAIGALVASCNNKKDKKDDTTKTTNTDSKTQDHVHDPVLSLDVTTLKDEAAFLKAWEDFTTARMADEKKQKDDKNYEGHYLEFTQLYTKLLQATTAFSQTIQPAAAAVTFNEKVSAIQAKMYP